MGMQNTGNSRFFTAFRMTRSAFRMTAITPETEYQTPFASPPLHPDILLNIHVTFHAG
jgi:hypothetical protein